MPIPTSRILTSAVLAVATTFSCVSVSAGDTRGIIVFNDCDDTDVQFALRIRDDGVWTTVFWWEFEPNGIYALIHDGRQLTTDNNVAYFYAEGDNATWSGRWEDDDDRTYSVNDRELRFRKFEFVTDDDGNYFTKISCADTSREILVRTIEDSNVPQSTEIIIVYEPFRYVYAYLVDKRRYPHVYVVAVNPNDPDASYYTDAGVAGFKDKKERVCNNDGQLCSVVKNAKIILEDNSNQQRFTVDLPFNEVVERMKRYSNATNETNIRYSWYKRNCAGYVFSFIREALDRYIRPSPPIDPGNDIKVLGWDKELNIDWRGYSY